MTVPQRVLLAALGRGWVPEFAYSLGRRTPGYPSHYKIDIAEPNLKIAIEVDGFSHHSRRLLDQKKDEKLRSLGWGVLRFWNRDILTWNAGAPQTGTSISTILAERGIHLSRSTDG
jgi:very-short-patch-repair endonuclease